MPQLDRLNESSPFDCLECEFATALTPSSATYVIVNRGHSRKGTVHKLALQALRRETVDDLRRIGNKVLMSNNGSETRSFTSSESTTEVAMSISRPKVNDIRKDAKAVLVLFGIELDSLRKPLPFVSAPPHA